MALKPVDLGSPPSSDKPEITQEHIVAGMAAVFKIADKWELSNDELQLLLGSPSRATFFKWKKNDVRSVPHDTVARISYILGIYKDLQILYADPAIADGWVKRPNQVFGGETARDRLVAGELVDIAYVRDYLDGVRGGWA